MLAIRAGVEPAIGCGDRLELTGYRSLEVPGPGAVAHMSLHQKPTMSKSRRDSVRRTTIGPRFTGGRLSVSVGDRSRWRWKPSAPRRWSPSSRGFGFGQHGFCIFMSFLLKSRKTHGTFAHFRAVGLNRPLGRLPLPGAFGLFQGLNLRPQPLPWPSDIPLYAIERPRRHKAAMILALSSRPVLESPPAGACHGDSAA